MHNSLVYKVDTWAILRHPADSQKPGINQGFARIVHGLPLDTDISGLYAFIQQYAGNLFQAPDQRKSQCRNRGTYDI